VPGSGTGATVTLPEAFTESRPALPRSRSPVRVRGEVPGAIPVKFRDARVKLPESGSVRTSQGRKVPLKEMTVGSTDGSKVKPPR
jgi:hypothetical protein